MGCSGSPSFSVPSLYCHCEGALRPWQSVNPWLPCVSGAAKLAEGAPPIDPKTSQG